MTSIEAGKLDRKILVQQMNTTISPSGHPAKSWANKFYAWASVRAVRGSEIPEFSREKSAIFVSTFQIRFNKDLKSTDRILYDGYAWDIVSITPWGRLNREVLEIVAHVVDAGEVVND